MRLRLRGVDRLRAVDASVMPTMIAGNINVSVIMIAEKGAAMALEDANIQRSNFSSAQNLLTKTHGHSTIPKLLNRPPSSRRDDSWKKSAGG